MPGDRIDSKEESNSRCLDGDGSSRCVSFDSTSENSSITYADIQAPFDPSKSPNAKDAQVFVDKMELAPYNPAGADEALSSMRDKLGGMTELDRLDLLKGIKHFKDKNPISPFAMEVSVKDNGNGTVNVVDVDVTNQYGHRDLLDTKDGKLVDRIQELMTKGTQAIGLSLFETAAKDPSLTEDAYENVLELANGNARFLGELINKSPELAKRIDENFSQVFAGTGLEAESKEFLGALTGKQPSGEFEKLVNEAADIKVIPEREQQLAGAYKTLGDFALTDEQRQAKRTAEKSLSTSDSLSRKHYEQLKAILTSR